MQSGLVWLLAASCVWMLQRLISGRLEKTVPENDLTLFWGAVRTVLVVVMCVCSVVGVIKMVDWLWHALGD